MKNVLRDISEIIETLKEGEGYLLNASEKEISLVIDHSGHRIIVRSNDNGNFIVRDLTSKRESSMTTIEAVCFMNDLMKGERK